MAVLGKIRQRSILLIGIIGFALFAFIAGDMFRSCDSHRAEASQRVGELNGKKLDIQKFNEMVEEMKIVQGGEVSDQLYDQVWQTYVTNQVLEDECEELGLTVTKKELENVLADGTNQILTQTPFVNQQTGKFDYNMVKQALNESKANPQMAEQAKAMQTYWSYIEKNLRQTLLQQKYQALLAGCLISNNITAKAMFDASNVESTVDLVAIPYSSINDNDVKIEDGDYKAKYEEMKYAFYNPEESRDIQYVDFLITPSSADMAAYKKEFAKYKSDLSGDSAQNVADIVRKANSLVAYNGLPKPKTMFSADIAQLIDTTKTGVSEVKEIKNQAEHTMNVLKIVNKETLPDSIEFRMIAVSAGKDTKVKADSIADALAKGAEFETLAKKFNQTGEKTWAVSAQLQMVQDLTQEDLKKYFYALVKGEKNKVQKVELANVTLVLEVTDQKDIKEMYNVAVITKNVEFSSQTRQDAYNKFNSYVAKCKGLDDLKKYAKENGYEVKQGSVQKTNHEVVGINSTKDILRWIFNDDTKTGDMHTEHIECGNNGDHLLVVVLDKIHEEGYLAYNDEMVKTALKPFILNDKKAEKIMEKVKNYDTAKSYKGAKTLEVKQISFAQPAFIPELGPEPAVSGAVASTPKGKTCKKVIKGNQGVYMLKVKDQKNLGKKFNKKEAAEQAHSKALMTAQRFMNDLMLSAGIKDNRYLFF